MQDWSLDLFFELPHKFSCPRTSNDVYIVAIKDWDYSNLFGSQSRLKPEKVHEIVDKVLRLKPTVIVGVDLDTKDAVWQTECNTTRLLPDSGSRVVWARTPAEAPDQTAGNAIQRYLLLGGCQGDQPSEGIPRFPLDSDGVVRRYVRHLDVDQAGAQESFALAIAKKYAHSLCASSDSRERKIGTDYFTRLLANTSEEESKLVHYLEEESKILNFDNWEFEEISAGDLLGDKEKANQRKDKVGGKIVLLGGEFEDARDSYDTPIAHKTPGVVLNAIAIESELHRCMISEPSRAVKFIADIVMGTFFVLIFWWLESWPFEHKLTLSHFLYGTALTIVIALVFSWGIFQCSIWLSFIPILIGCNIHQYIEHAKKIKKGTED